MNIMTLNQNGFKSMAKFGLVALMLAAAPAVCRATVVYTNFGGGFTFNNGAGNTVGTDGLGDNLAQANTFTPTATYTFTSLEIALSCNGACPDNFTVAILGDSGGLPNAASVLDSFIVAGSGLQALGGSAYLTLTGGSPTLVSGTPYWIAVLSDTNNQIVWNWNTTGDPSAEATAFAGGGVGDLWYALGATPGAYQVDGSGSPVPEPGTLGMILGGGLLLGLLRKVRS